MMSFYLKRYGIIFLVLFLGIHFWVKFQNPPHQNSTPIQKVGESVLDFQGKTIDGQVFDLKSVATKNKILVINFWETLCGPCRQELPDLERIYSKFRQDGFEIIGVFQNSPSMDVQKMVQKNSLTYPMVFDQTKSITRQFKIVGVPTTFVVDSNLKILRRHEGIDFGLEQFIEKELKGL